MAENIVGIKIEVGGKEQVVTSMGELRKVLKDLKFEQLSLSEQFGATSEQAINAAKRIKELEDRVNQAKEATDQFDPGQRFQAFSTAASQLAGAFGAVQGAMALVGIESEDLQKQLVKIQGAMALSQGLNQIADLGKSFDQLKITAVNTFRVIKAEIGATGIGAVILGISAAVVLLIENFDELGGVTEDVTRKNKAYADTLEETNTATTDAIKNVNKVKIAFDEAKTGVITKKDALNIYNETLGDALGKTDSLEVAEKNLNSKAQAFITATMLKAQANAMYAQSAKLQAEALTAGQKDNVSWWEKSLAAVNSFFTNGIVTYKTSLASYQAINTQEIRDGLKKQSDIVLKEADKLTSEAEKKQKEAGIKLGVKAEDNKEVKAEKEKQNTLKDLLEGYRLFNLKRDADQLGELEEQKKEEIQINKEANDQIAADDAFARGEKLKGYTQVAKNKEALIKKEKDLEKARFEESLKWATTYAESAQGLSDALYAAKLAGVEKGSKEEQEILKKQFETNKKIQIAQTIISGLNGIVNALAAKSVLPEPFGAIARGVNATMIGATTAATISKIAQTQFGGTTGSMSVSGGAGGNAPMTPSVPIQQTVTQLNQGTINALGNQAIKAYVLESDVTNSQNRVTRILNSSRFK
jgi:hypothetical protein